jgi:hypothetical protein
MPGNPLPQFVAPMTASSIKKAFDSPDRIYETKLDGYRAIAVIDSAGEVRLWSARPKASRISGWRRCDFSISGYSLIADTILLMKVG